MATWSIAWTSAPAGMTLDPESGALTGIPTTAGVYTGTLTHIPTGGTRSVTLKIFRPNRRFIAELIDGTLPPGLSLNQENMAIHGGSDPCLQGIPTLAGTYNFTLRFHDRLGQTKDQAFSLVVA